MSKVYIISTKKVNAETCESRVFSFEDDQKVVITEDIWSRFFDGFQTLLPGPHFYCELEASEGCRVYAIDQLPDGHEFQCARWIQSLSDFFLREGDDKIIFVLHDKVIHRGAQLHFYSFERHSKVDNREIHVFGFQHKSTDLIGRRLCRKYASAADFSRAMDPVLRAVHYKDVLEKNRKQGQYPEPECWNYLVNQGLVNKDLVLSNMFPDPRSSEYQSFLTEIHKSLMKRYYND